MDDFDGAARFYDLLPVPTHAKVLAAALVAHVGIVLDIGGGTGRFTARILGPHHRGIVLDASQDMVRRARTRRGLDAVQARAEQLPLPDARVDAILCTEAFHHFGDRQDAALDEMARVLRPDGLVLLEEPDTTTFLGRAMARGERMLGMGSRFRSPGGLAAALALRFEQVDQQQSGRFTVMTTARRPRRATG